MLFRVVLGLLLVGVSQQEKTIAEMQSWFKDPLKECLKDHPLTTEEISTMLDTHSLADTDNSKCLAACVLKKSNFLNDDGNFDFEQMKAFAEEKFKDDPKTLESSSNIYKACKDVNDIPVADGTKGCEKSFHMIKCLVENAPKMGIPLQ